MVPSIHHFVGGGFIPLPFMAPVRLHLSLPILSLFSLLLRLLPIILFLEATTVIALSGYNFYNGFVVLVFVMLIFLVWQHSFARHYYSWLASVRPIEETDWAYLVARIHGWAQLGGIEFSSILIQKDMLGTTNVRLVGLSRPTLVLSETLLRYSE
jgi:hypothetical protein